MQGTRITVIIARHTENPRMRASTTPIPTEGGMSRAVVPGDDTHLISVLAPNVRSSLISLIILIDKKTMCKNIISCFIDKGTFDTLAGPGAVWALICIVIIVDKKRNRSTWVVFDNIDPRQGYKLVSWVTRNRR
eukprot:gene23075-1403_t